jgi:hypothetical protein
LRRAIFILHVVGEHHQLRGVDEAPEARVATARDDAVALGQHAFAVVGFLTSINASGMPLMSKVMSGRNSSSPFLQGQLGDDVEAVVVKLLEIDQPSA